MSKKEKKESTLLKRHANVFKDKLAKVSKGKFKNQLNKTLKF